MARENTIDLRGIEYPNVSSYGLNISGILLSIDITVMGMFHPILHILGMGEFQFV